MARLSWKRLRRNLFGEPGTKPPPREDDSVVETAPVSEAVVPAKDDAAPAPASAEHTEAPSESAEDAPPSEQVSIRGRFGTAERELSPSAPPSEATQADMERSLKWRSQVLLNTPGIEDPKGDGRLLVNQLLGDPETVVSPLPQFAQNALSVSRDPDSSARDLALLFERDPALTRPLLQRANSPWYRRGTDSVVSIVAAVQRIGARGVENIFLETVVRGLLCRPGGVYNRTVATEWARILDSSAQARQLAPAFDLDPDTAYSMGLLHDVGKLVCFDRISIMRGQLRRNVEIPDTFLTRLMKHMHEPLGGQAVLRWDLGREAAYAVAHHHRRPCPEGHEPMTELLYLADHLDLASATFDNWDEAWAQGGLTVDMDRVRETCRRAA